MSTSLHLWRDGAQDVFAELELAHRAVHGRGQRFLTRQITYAYVTALAAQFQRYCRAVHTETAQAIAGSMRDPTLARLVEDRLLEGRQLDRGNANVPNLGSDFGRFYFRLWDVVLAHDRRNRRRKAKLEALMRWRNAIGHGDVEQKHEEGVLVPLRINLKVCQEWNAALGGLVISIDEVLETHCEDLGVTLVR
jgi:hypothetical protein